MRTPLSVWTSLFGLFFCVALAHAAPESSAPSSLEPSLAAEPRELRYLGYREEKRHVEVFVTTTDTVVWHINTGHSGLIILTLDNTRVGSANHSRPLDTRFFNGPVSWIEAQPIEGPSSSVRIVISSDTPELATVHQSERRLVIEIPRAEA